MMLEMQIMPIIRATVPRVVRPVGAEDAGELVQDTLCSAAQMVDAAEKAGKPLHPSGIAYYAIQRTKSGRRSTSAFRADAMCAGAQLDRKVSLDSMDAPLEGTVEGDEAGTLHDLLAGQSEDPARAAAREIDWSELLQRLDDREIDILLLTAEGGRLNKLARKFGVSQARVCQLRRELGARIHDLWGVSALQDATRESSWQRNNVRATRERLACRRERWQASAR
jgi:DNA-binding CsgD family transcriptional regulator